MGQFSKIICRSSSSLRSPSVENRPAELKSVVRLVCFMILFLVMFLVFFVLDGALLLLTPFDLHVHCTWLFGLAMHVLARDATRTRPCRHVSCF